MADITSPRIESIPESRSGTRDTPDRKQQAKAAAAGKQASIPAPQIGAPEEEDKHNLDEMA